MHVKSILHLFQVNHFSRFLKCRQHDCEMDFSAEGDEMNETAANIYESAKLQNERL